MIQIPALALDTRPARYLRHWQQEIDDIRDYATRVQAGKDRFSSRNSNRNATFKHVKEVLTKMCQGARRCVYCEDSVADEVEHIQPKDLYPELVFTWDNYLYACGPCNGPKNNQFAVIHGHLLQLEDVTRAKDDPIEEPLSGVPALINPRTENPLHFLFLDLLNTFAFSVRDAESVSEADRVRADYTIKILRLNARDYLVQARRIAFATYRARLSEYVNKKREGASQADLNRHRSELQEVGHRTVWHEIQRQQTSYPVLASLFAAAPEALAW